MTPQAGDVAARPAVGPDRTRRSLRPRPIAFGLLGVGALAAAIGIATWSGPPSVLALALLGAVGLDAAIAGHALARLDLSLINPVDAVAGQRVVYVLETRGMARPAQLVRPAAWPSPVSQAIGLDATDAGSVELNAPGRGVVTNLVFDLVATGPLGLWDASRRVRLWFPVPLAVGPAPLTHDPDWPRLRTLPLGETESTARGDDLFRGVRAYVRGDPRRSVHWPATAHHGTLMVRERDGLEQVVIRVVVHLPVPGIASEYAAARAAWMVEQASARGWVVHLTTLERAAPEPAPPPLVRPHGPVLVSPPAPSPTVVVDQRIAHPGQARQQLARATYGSVTFGPWAGLTRLVSPEGDRWI